MSAEQLATRIIAEQSGVPSFKIRRGNIREDDFYKITEAARDMQTMPFYIDQTGGISIAQLAARARRLKRQRGLDVLVVDYIQLLSGSAKKGDSRVQEVTEITTGLKALAKELDVPILALSQLSRQVEARDDKRPQLSDLRESGSIEQDADVVMFVFREEYYLKNKEPKAGTEEYFKWQAEMEPGARPGRGHHRQAASRPDGHRAARLPGRRDPLRRPRRRGQAAGTDGRLSVGSDHRDGDETGPPAREAGGLLTIDLAALAANWRLLRERAGGSRMRRRRQGGRLRHRPRAGRPARSRAAGCRTFFVAHLSEAAPRPRGLPGRDRLRAERPAARHGGDLCRLATCGRSSAPARRSTNGPRSAAPPARACRRRSMSTPA